jgi:tetratricopeptide (TPR) repeat protein
VAGDHGESLGEHGEPTHGMLLYEPAMRVPLIVAGPGVPAATRSEPVGLIDVAPTILRLAGLEPAGSSEGRDLLSAPPEAPAIYGETEYPRLAGWSPLASLTGARWKLVDAPAPELYDISIDPAERTNVAESQQAVVRGMRARLVELRAQQVSHPAGEVAPDVAARLRTLGYVAGPARPVTGGAGRNPASMMPVWAAFESALGELSRSDASRALGRLAALAREHPDAPVFQTTLARALADRGRRREALAIYRRAVARWPDDSMLFHDLAVAARAAGDPHEARRAEEAALALDGRNALAHNGLGLLLADAGAPREAARAFERASALDPTNAQYPVNLGNALREASDAAAAGEAYRRALAIDGSLPDALNGLAVVLVQSGRAAEAVPLLERALAREPGLVEARLNLGIAAQETGDLRRARAAYEEVLRSPARFARERRAATALLRSLPPTR